MKKRILVLLVAVLMCAVLCASASAERKNTAYSKLGFALDASVVDNHLVVKAATADGEETFVAEDVSEELLNARTHKGDELISFGTIIDIAFDANGKVADISKLFNLDKRNVWFDTIKYGAEFTPVNGKAGNVLASGWVLGKTENTVVIGDTNHFEETYTLADNARKFTDEGGTVSISAAESDDYVEVSVADTGCGLSEEQQASLFTPLAPEAGHGFGLLNCKGIIEKYRKMSSLFSVCRLSVESRVGREAASSSDCRRARWR